MEERIKSLNCKPLKPRIENYSFVLRIYQWREYSLDKFFAKIDLKINAIDNGEFPLISSVGNNNGIIGYIDKNRDDKLETFKENRITIDMFCNAYYQLH